MVWGTLPVDADASPNYTAAQHATHHNNLATLYNGSPFAHVKFVAGSYYTTNFVPGAFSGGGITQDVAYTAPIWIGESHTFDRIASVGSFYSSTGNWRMAIYNSDGSMPTSLVLDAGTVSVTATGLIAITISQTLAAGPYFLALVKQGATGSFNPYLTASSWLPGRGQDGSVYSFQQGRMPQMTGVTGAFPGTFTAASITADAHQMPLIMLRA